MSQTLLTIDSTRLADQLPVLPETRSLEPLVQCGVLYLGTAPSSAGHRGLDSVQEPLSHRYPVDGTNTVRGIDAVLCVYDNGIQLAFTRQPHAVIFFPISSLIYCASLRFTIIEHDQTKPASITDWRFAPLDTIPIDENKHPPLFCMAVQRTQILAGDECHCFITKSTDAAIALVQTVSQVYATLQLGTKCLKSPIFYQLDRFGRKLSEITGIIYISPANDDESQLNRSHSNRLTDESLTRHYLFDPSYDGYFYRTDASIIEQWQLWDDDVNFNRSRPRPPASPFGLHEGLYHDDTTQDIQRYLRRMEDEEPSCSCSSSSSQSSTSSSQSSTSTCSISTEYSRKANRTRIHQHKVMDDTDQFDSSLLNLQASSFEPVLPQQNIKTKKGPIIIEKVLPKPILSIPILNPILPQQPVDPPDSEQETNINHNPPSDFPDISYQINERGEKITKEGNRIVFMDVVQMNTDQTQIDPPSYKSSTSRSRSKRQRPSKKIPVIDIQSIEKLFNEESFKNQRSPSLNLDNQSTDQSNLINHRTTTHKFETIDRYLEDYQEKSTDHSPQSDSSSIKNHRGRSSLISSTNSSKNPTHSRRSHSTLITGPGINYVERPPILSIPKQNSPIPPVLTNEKIHQYISDIYGTPQSIKSTSSSINTPQEIKPVQNPMVDNSDYIPAFRYMQSSMSRNVFQQYRNAY